MISFRKARIEDSVIYFKWANDLLVRQQSFNSDPILLANHEQWFRNRLSEKYTEMLLFSDDNELIGQVRIQRSDNFNAVISVSISSEHRGKGYAIEMLKMASSYYINKYPKITIEAFIKENNSSSIAAFERAGYIMDSNLLYFGYPSYKFIYNGNR